MSIKAAVVQVQLTGVEGAQNVSSGSSSSGSTNTTSSRPSPALLWLLWWNAKPIDSIDGENAFAYLMSPRALVVDVGETYHLPFCFRPPRDTPPNTRFSQRWLIALYLSQNVSRPLSHNETMAEPTREVEILFVGDTIAVAPQPPIRQPRVVVVKSLLKCKGTPLIFRQERQQCQLDLINTSHSERLIVTLGPTSSPFFKLIKPTSRRFPIE